MVDIDRTILFGLKPRTSDVPFEESLSSYIIRLADAHVVGVGDLISDCIALVLDKKYLTNGINRGGNRFYDGAHSLNGFGTNSKDMVECLSILTGQELLSNLTLDRIFKGFSTRNLIRKNMAWCPKCLEYNDYYSLIWCLSAYTVCTKHSVILQEKCVVCDKLIPCLHRRSRVGICPYCNNYHFALKNYKQPLRQEYFISNDLEKLLKRTQKEQLFEDTTTLQRGLLYIINEQFNGTINHFAKYAGISKTTMWDWCNGKARPSLNNLLNISYKLGISILDLYDNFEFNKSKLLDTKEEYIRIIEKRSKAILNENHVEAYLRNVEKESDIYIPITKIASALGCSTKYLYTNFSEYTQRISLNNKRIKEIINQNRIMKIRTLIKKEFIKDILEGKIPTRKTIEESLHMPRVFKNRTFKNYYFELSLIHEFLMKGMKPK